MNPYFNSDELYFTQMYLEESLELEKEWGKALPGGNFARKGVFLVDNKLICIGAAGRVGGNNRERHLRQSALSAAVQKSGNNRKGMCL